MAVRLSHLLSRNALVIFAIVGAAAPGDDDLMIAMHGDVRVKQFGQQRNQALGQADQCSVNPSSSACVVPGDDDVMVAVQSRVRVRRSAKNDKQDEEKAIADEAKKPSFHVHNASTVEEPTENPSSPEVKTKMSLLGHVASKIDTIDMVKEEMSKTETKISDAASMIEKEMSETESKISDTAAVLEKEMSETAKMIEDTVLPQNTQGISSLSKAKTFAVKDQESAGSLSDVSGDGETSQLISDYMHPKEAASPVQGPVSLQETFSQMVMRRFQLSSTSMKAPSIAIALIMLLLICTCVGACSFAGPNKFPFFAEGKDSVDEDVTKSLDARKLMMDRWPAMALGPDKAAMSSNAARAGQASAAAPSSRPNSRGSIAFPLPGPRQSVSVPGSALGSMASVSAPGSQVVVAQQVHNLGGHFWSADPNGQKLAPEEEDIEVMPPALCPSMVMPSCEARFGVPMFELAEVRGEGEVTIVGLSGNPLLRALIKRDGDMRSLEIGMLESGSEPRAIIAPPMQSSSGKGGQLLISGMRSEFYGTLEMQGGPEGGTCSVIKEGKRVLEVEGCPENLSLSVVSGVGFRLASVRLSSKTFGGVDHVEIRVERGVDTVLVLSVVLAVLLLSPYLEPQ